MPDSQSALAVNVAGWMNQRITVDPNGLGARLVSVGIQESGLVDALNVSGAATVDAILRSSAILQEGFDELASHLAAIATSLDGIEDALRNPLRVQAAERYRRGLRALKEGWLDEASDEFTAAIDDNPYDPLSRLFFGLVMTRRELLDDAERSLLAAVKYAGSEAENKPVLASAALLTAALQVESGRSGDAVQTLRAAHARVPSCGELVLAVWRQTKRDGDLDLALRLAPELIVDALATGDEGEVLAVAQAVAQAEDGPVIAAIRLDEFVPTLADVIPRGKKEDYYFEPFKDSVRVPNHQLVASGRDIDPLALLPVFALVRRYAGRQLSAAIGASDYVYLILNDSRYGSSILTGQPVDEQGRAFQKRWMDGIATLDRAKPAAEEMAEPININRVIPHLATIAAK